MSISQKINTILEKIPDHVKLVAVSKTKPKEDISVAYKGGYRIFGENKPQELAQKYKDLPKDIEWHFIGHLQTNKVKYIAPFVHLVHAVDSMKLMKEINKQAAKNNRIINCLLQFHIASEENKFGLNMVEAKALLDSDDFSSLHSIQIAGVMGMATYTDQEDVIRKEFGNLKAIFDHLKTDYFCDKEEFKEISMGMSGDYELAIDEGSTMIRLGSSIFGSRF
jgi:pyridoxal phosphate enzyme (YggS family)